jgi:hypothetical protein
VRVPTTSALPGPAPTRHQPRRIHLIVDALPDGQLRISTPHARGWAATARNHHQLAHAVGRAFNETAVAAYAGWSKQLYDLDKLTAKDDPTEPARRPTRGQRPVTTRLVSYGRGRAVRPDQAHPAQWEKLDDGTYRSPAGRIYRDPQFIARLEARRAAFNLPIRGAAS